MRTLVSERDRTLTLFITRRGLFAEQFPDESCQPVKRNLADGDIEFRLSGERTFGTYTSIPNSNGPPLAGYGCKDVHSTAGLLGLKLPVHKSLQRWTK